MVREDVGLGPLWAAGAWVLSTKIRRLARRKGVSYRLMLMHPAATTSTCWRIWSTMVT